jgi:multidrug transporter EmrE-like cation transporter
MEAMPRHDPIPTSRAPDFERASVAWARYKRMMKWMVLVAITCILLSFVYLKSSGDPVPVHMMIATAAGVGFTILVGTGLMGLVFLSSRSGHDEEAGAKPGKDGE